MLWKRDGAKYVLLTFHSSVFEHTTACPRAPRPASTYFRQAASSKNYLVSLYDSGRGKSYPRGILVYVQVVLPELIPS